MPDSLINSILLLQASGESRPRVEFFIDMKYYDGLGKSLVSSADFRAETNYRIFKHV
jgi:hypothetical protein